MPPTKWPPSGPTGQRSTWAPPPTAPAGPPFYFGVIPTFNSKLKNFQKKSQIIERTCPGSEPGPPTLKYPRSLEGTAVWIRLAPPRPDYVPYVSFSFSCHFGGGIDRWRGPIGEPGGHSARVEARAVSIFKLPPAAGPASPSGVQRWEFSGWLDGSCFNLSLHLY